MQYVVLFILLILYCIIGTLFNAAESQPEHEEIALHDHARLQLIVNGTERALPANIGIESDLWNDHDLDMYSANPDTLSPIHTHDFDGLIHIEPVAFREFNFGDFLDIWGLDQSMISNVSINGEITTDFLEHTMRNGDQLVLELSIDTENFTQLSDPESNLTVQYPSSWNSSKTSQPPSDFRPAVGEEFISKIDLIAPESHYLLSPRLSIQIAKLPERNITLDEYTIARLPLELRTNLSNSYVTIPYLEQSVSSELDGNPAHRIVVYTDHRNEDDYSGEHPLFYQEKSMKLWTIKNDMVYAISYSVLPELPEFPSSSYDDYYPIVKEVLNSVTVK